MEMAGGPNFCDLRHKDVQTDNTATGNMTSLLDDVQQFKESQVQHIPHNVYSSLQQQKNSMQHTGSSSTSKPSTSSNSCSANTSSIQHKSDCQGESTCDHSDCVPLEKDQHNQSAYTEDISLEQHIHGLHIHTGSIVDSDIIQTMPKEQTKMENHLDGSTMKQVEDSAKEKEKSIDKSDDISTGAEDKVIQDDGHVDLDPLRDDLYEKLCVENGQETAELVQWDNYNVCDDLQKACKKLSYSEKQLYTAIVSIFAVLTFAMVLGLFILQAQISMTAKEIVSQVSKKSVNQGMYTLYFDYLESAQIDKVDLRANTTIFVH